MPMGMTFLLCYSNWQLYINIEIILNTITKFNMITEKKLLKTEPFVSERVQHHDEELHKLSKKISESAHDIINKVMESTKVLHDKIEENKKSTTQLKEQMNENTALLQTTVEDSKVELQRRNDLLQDKINENTNQLQNIETRLNNIAVVVPYMQQPQPQVQTEPTHDHGQYELFKDSIVPKQIKLSYQLELKVM